jgi:hypothetical protein
VVAIAEGESHSLALRGDGSVVGWGDNLFGQTSVPPSVTNAMAIAAGVFHSLALLADGTVAVWGSSAATNVPTAATNVVALAGGYDFSLVLRADGSLVAWGNSIPEQGSITNLTNAVAISAGAFHALALLADGTTVAWGNNFFGQTNLPVFSANVQAIASSGDNNLAVLADNSIAAWGDDYYGQTNPPPLANGVFGLALGQSHTVLLPTNASPRLTVTADQPVSLAAGLPPGVRTACQWTFNETNLPDATRPLLSFAHVQPTDAGVYRAGFTTPAGVLQSLPITLDVRPPTIQFNNAQTGFLPNSSDFRLQLVNASGQGEIVIYTSTNLTDWMPIFTNPPVTGTLEYIHSIAPVAAQRFYQAVEQP